MDHAEVQARLENAFADGSGITAVEQDASAEGAEVRRHLESCEACGGEYGGWIATARALAAAAPDDMRAPDAARIRILAAAARTTEAAETTPSEDAAPGRSRRLVGQGAPHPVALALTAAAAVVLFVAGALLGEPLGITPGTDDREPSARIAAAIQRVVAQPDHVTVSLEDARGAAAGTVLFDPASRELVVISDALDPPPGDARYECFLERDGTRTWVGRMRIEYGTAWWVGPMEEPSDAGTSGDRFVIVLGGGSGPPVLGGEF